MFFFLGVSILSILRSKICFSFAESRKIKKKMTHHELISEVLMTLRFPAEASDIKRRIESLIERELLGTGFGDQLDMSRKVTIPSIWRPKVEEWQLDSLANIPSSLWCLRCLERQPPNEQGVTCYTYLAWNTCGLSGVLWIPYIQSSRPKWAQDFTHFGRSRPRRAPKLCSWIQSISMPKNPGKRCSHFRYDSTVPDKEDSCDSANFRSQAIEKEVADAVLGSIWKATGRHFSWFNSINSGDGHATSKLLHFEPPGLC